jgi:predicted aminopeptidase
LAQKVRDYSRDVLKLRVKGSFGSYSPGERKHLITVISAAPQAELKPYTWWFPFVGRVPYKGFFERAMALGEAKKLEGRGYDVHVTESDAFSTLGWFDDPIQSQFLRTDQVAYVDLLIHELFHNTMYIPGQADFNESAATFAGHRGAIAFFEWSEGIDSDSYDKAIGRWKDSLKFSGFLEGILSRLNSVYAAQIGLEEKLHQKEGIFSQSQEEFKILQVTLQTKRKGFLETRLNNAVLLHYWIYHRDLHFFERVYALAGEDLPRALARIQECGRDRENPFERLRGTVQSSSASNALTP